MWLIESKSLPPDSVSRMPFGSAGEVSKNTAYPAPKMERPA
jgi:hypothetical protein